MATPAQILANQHNARKSTGPKTEAGKAASSRNACRHGLSSAFTVLLHEDQDEFDESLQTLREEHQPATQHQGFLVDQIAKTAWLLARAQRLEAVAFDQLAGAELDPDDPDSTIIARMSETNPNVLATLQRYAQNAERSYYRAIRELAASKKPPTEADSFAALTSLLMRTPPSAHPPLASAQRFTEYGLMPNPNPTTQPVCAAAAAGAERSVTGSFAASF